MVHVYMFHISLNLYVYIHMLWKHHLGPEFDPKRNFPTFAHPQPGPPSWGCFFVSLFPRVLRDTPIKGIQTCSSTAQVSGCVQTPGTSWALGNLFRNSSIMLRQRLRGWNSQPSMAAWGCICGLAGVLVSWSFWWCTPSCLERLATEHVIDRLLVSVHSSQVFLLIAWGGPNPSVTYSRHFNHHKNGDCTQTTRWTTMGHMNSIICMQLGIYIYIQYIVSAHTCLIDGLNPRRNKLAKLIGISIRSLAWILCLKALKPSAKESF